MTRQAESYRHRRCPRRRMIWQQNPIGLFVNIISDQYEVAGIFQDLKNSQELGQRVRCVIPAGTLQSPHGDVIVN